MAESRQAPERESDSGQAGAGRLPAAAAASSSAAPRAPQSQPAAPGHQTQPQRQADDCSQSRVTIILREQSELLQKCSLVSTYTYIETRMLSAVFVMKLKAYDLLPPLATPCHSLAGATLDTHKHVITK